MAHQSITGIHHVAIHARDSSSVARFYATAANFKATRVDVTPLDTQGTLVATRNAFLRVLPLDSPQASPPPTRPVNIAGITHICVQSTSMDTLYASFAAANATFHTPPVELGTRYRYSYARDSGGNVVELEGVPPVWADDTPWLAHVSFTAFDRDLMSNFYSKLLNARPTLSPPLGPNPRMDALSGLNGTKFQAAWIGSLNVQVEIIQYLSPPTRAAQSAHDDEGYAYVCFEVESLRQAMDHFEACGATPAKPIDTLSNVTHACYTDPEGNRLALMCIPAAMRTDWSINSLPDIDVVERARQLVAALTSESPV